MFTLVIGGAASGKSEYAEELILRAGPLPRAYIAAMEPFDEECRARIKRHRALRARKNFRTIECYTGLEKLRLSENGAVLLECISNLTANELYSPAGAAASGIGKPSGVDACGIYSLTNTAADGTNSPAGAAASGIRSPVDGTASGISSHAEPNDFPETDEISGIVENAILRGIDALRSQCRELVVVSNEVFSGGSFYEGDTFRYLKILASVNRALAVRADRVAEIVCGRAVYYKGREPV